MSKKLKLTDREWREFLIVELFDSIERGKRLTQQHRVSGGTPFVTAGENTNGISSFINNPEQQVFERGITLDMFANTFYQNYSFQCDDNITVLTLRKKSAHIHLFLIVLLNRLREKYSYAKQVRPHRLKRESIMLPHQADGTPDWAFMEAYMRQVEEELLAEALPKLEQQLLDNIVTLGALDDREWKEFLFSDVFTKIQRGKRLKKDDHIKGEVPYVSSTANNNGLDGFVGNTERVRIFSDCITLANSGSVGSAFFQEFTFVASDHVTALKIKGADKYVYLFMLPIIGRLSEKYGFNREINDARISREKLLLPVTFDGTPDWEFMSAFMKRVEQETLLPPLRHFKNKKCNQMLMGGG